MDTHIGAGPFGFQKRARCYGLAGLGWPRMFGKVFGWMRFGAWPLVNKTCGRERERFRGWIIASPRRCFVDSPHGAFLAPADAFVARCWCFRLLFPSCRAVRAIRGDGLTGYLVSPRRGTPTNFSPSGHPGTSARSVALPPNTKRGLSILSYPQMGPLGPHPWAVWKRVGWSRWSRRRR